MAKIDWQGRARRISGRLKQLAEITDEPGRLTRTLLSPAVARANRLVAQWMTEAGLEAAEDFIGNLVGIRRAAYPQSQVERVTSGSRVPGARRTKTLVIGSHLDTVRDAGHFDGALGVVLAIEVADALAAASGGLPFDLMVAGFADEEGVRFQTAFLGSKAFCGLLRDEDLNVSNSNETLRELLSAGRPEPFVLPPPTLADVDLLGYFEVHIEQGPVLEARNLSLGVVTGIAGQSRFRFNWSGKASHAGTTPIHLRKDALLGAAQFALQVEAACTRFPGLVATVGELSVAPNVSNVVPARVTHSLDIRHQEDEVRSSAIHWLLVEAAQIAEERQLGLEQFQVHETQSLKCDPALAVTLAAAAKSVSGEIAKLPSGAGHDAVIFAGLCPIAMLFVRCRDGLSHHPDEFVSTDDVELALRAATTFVEELGSRS
jgi:allantoate deiminase